jgi:hypothetical protein
MTDTISNPARDRDKLVCTPEKTTEMNKKGEVANR